MAQGRLGSSRSLCLILRLRLDTRGEVLFWAGNTSVEEREFLLEGRENLQTVRNAVEGPAAWVKKVCDRPPSEASKLALLRPLACSLKLQSGWRFVDLALLRNAESKARDVGVLHPSLVLLLQYLVDSAQILLLYSPGSSLIDGPRCAIRHDRPKFSRRSPFLPSPPRHRSSPPVPSPNDIPQPTFDDAQH
jgi:hypothetical protein